MSELHRFPAGFRWGTATAAHQIEGGNSNNDWWEWEHRDGSPVAEPSGDACGSWERWPDDVEACAAIGVDNYRFSVEWSRIEPAAGLWSTAALDHYRRLCDSLRERDIDPVVTLHHFTTPRWITEAGGWANPATATRFAEFCEKVATALGDSVDMYCTINEPNIVSFMGYGFGMFPPGETDLGRVAAVNQVFIDAHHKAVVALKAAAPTAAVGLTLSMTDYQILEGGEETRRDALLLLEDPFLDAARGDDFIGVQTYSRARCGPNGLAPPEAGVEVLDIGYEYWPETLGATIRRTWEHTGGEVPIRVTENGISTSDDAQRIRYVHTALEGVLECLTEGINVTGYTYWSLLDNFEWAFGYGPHFGLVEVEREAPFSRTLKPSAQWFGEVIRANALRPVT